MSQSPNARRLLILSCSKSKRSAPQLLPAVERYNGPLFRVLRKFICKNPQEAQSLDVFVLSAKFGLISGEELIPDYNHIMTKARAEILHSEVMTNFSKLLKEAPYQELLVVMGKTYLSALDGFEDLLCDGLEIKICNGSYGRQQANLYDWLHQHPPCLPESSRKPGIARIREVEIELPRSQVIEIARSALTEGSGNPSRFQSWYVEIDDRKVAPKWLVSQLTDLPVRNFNTGQARRFLSRLGIEVKRA